MSGTVIDLRSGKEQPQQPPVEKPLAWIEPSVAPNIVVSLAPKVDVYGPLATVLWAFAERSIETSERELNAVIVSKITMPTTLLRAAGEALIAAADEADGDGKPAGCQ